MNQNFKKLHRLQALKMELEGKEKTLKIKEMSSKYGIDKMAVLIENNLDQAKLIIASQDVIEKLQKIAERLAELNAEEIMPLADSMKAAFGQEIAQKFEHVASQSIMAALESVRSAKDAIDNAVLQVEGKMAPEEDSDMAKYTPSDSTDTTDIDDSALDATTPSDDSGDDSTLLSTDVDDENTTDDGSSNPLGRDLKDSIDYSSLGKKAIEEGIVKNLSKWYLSENEKVLPNDKFKSFTVELLSKLKENKLDTIGRMYSKRLCENPNLMLKKVRAIASVIESNIKSTGKSNTSEILKKFIGENLNEESSQNILQLFCEEYGCSPVIYAAKLKRESRVEEDAPTNTTGALASGSGNTQSIGSTTPTTEPNSRQEQMKDDAISSIATKVANNPGVLNQPVSTAASDLNPEEKTAINNTISSDSDLNSSTTVKDFLQKQNNNKGLNS